MGSTMREWVALSKIWRMVILFGWGNMEGVVEHKGPMHAWPAIYSFSGTKRARLFPAHTLAQLNKKTL